MVNLTTRPIAEFQADQNSFTYSPKKAFTQAIYLIYVKLNKLIQSQMTKHREITLTKVDLREYETFNGNKIRSRDRLLTRNTSKRRRKYSYNYWVTKNPKTISRRPFALHLCDNVINVNVAKFYHNIKHNNIIEFYPLGVKYHFLLKAWLRTPILGKKTVDTTRISLWRPLKGVPQKSILSPAIMNVILDDLETSLFTEFFSHFGQKRKNATHTHSSYTLVQLNFLRYADVRRETFLFISVKFGIYYITRIFYLNLRLK